MTCVFQLGLSTVTRTCDFWGAVTDVGGKMDVIQVWVTVAMARNARAAAGCLEQCVLFLS